MPAYKICRSCGAHLDPGEHCECEHRDVPEMEEAQRVLRKRRPETDPNAEAVERAWREYDMR